jgi:hypothetical protein
MILLISASLVASIIGMSHWCLAGFPFLSLQLSGVIGIISYFPLQEDNQCSVSECQIPFPREKRIP